MLRLRDGQAVLWEELLPAEVRLLSPELPAVDALLDARAPHPTTLMKLTRRFGPEVVDELNRALLERAVADKLLRSRRLRVDTTAVEADVRHPTDSGLCAHAVSRMSRTVEQVKDAGLARRTPYRDRRRSAGKAVRRLSAALGRGGNSRPAVDRLTGELHALAKSAARQARRVLANATRTLRQGARQGGAQAVRPAHELEGAGRVIAQTPSRPLGSTRGRSARSGVPIPPDSLTPAAASAIALLEDHLASA